MILSDPKSLASLQRDDSEGSKPDTQQQRKETTSLLNKVRDDIEASYKHTEDWRKSALESYQFVEGEQWTDEEKKYLLDQRRPVLTLNKILPIVRLLSGMERQNREDMKVFPRTGGAVEDANLMTELVKFVDDDNMGQWVRTRKSQDVYVTGRGFIKTDVSYDENLQGDIVFFRKHPLSVFVDPMSESWTGDDWRWVADSMWLTEDEAKELWPDFEDLITVGDWLSGGTNKMPSDATGDTSDVNKLFLDEKTRRVRVVEYWYRRNEIVKIAVMPETGNVRLADEDFARKFLTLPPEEQARISFVQRKMPVIRVSTVMNWLLLQDKPSPFRHRMFPIIPYIGIQFFGEPKGIVEPLKDAQRLRNKVYSQALNHLNRSANSGWLNQAHDGADPGQLERFGSVPGQVITYRTTKPEKIEPSVLSAGHFQLSKDADAELKEISLINAELQGVTSQVTVSGRAIEARQRGGLTANEDFFDNQLLGDKVLGLQVIALVQQVYTPERIMRVVENRIVRDPEGVLASLAGQSMLPEIIDQTLKSEYDLIVDRQPASASVRQLQLQTIMQAAKDFPGAIPPDVVIDMTDLPDSLKLRIKTHIQQVMAMGGLPSNPGPQREKVRGAPGVSTGGPEPAPITD